MSCARSWPKPQGSLTIFEFSSALVATERFFWRAFTDNYVELVKHRAKNHDDPEGRTSAVVSLRLGISVLLRMFAPMLPTITEEIWSWAFAGETEYKSIHHASWPTLTDLSVDSPSNQGSFQAACGALAAVRKAKSEAGISIVRPLVSLTLLTDREGQGDLKGVLTDVTAASRAPSINFAEGTTTGEWRYVARIKWRQGSE